MNNHAKSHDIILKFQTCDPVQCGSPCTNLWRPNKKNWPANVMNLFKSDTERCLLKE